jgi:hypothetical protein
MTKMSNVNIENIIKFIEERLDFIEAIKSSDALKSMNKEEWNNAQINLVMLLKAMKSNQNGESIDWLEFENELVWLSNFTNDCISHTLFAIDVYENVLKEKDGALYENAVKDIEHLKLVSDEINKITMYRK